MNRPSSNIHLPVSIGEAIDKLTILDIKMNKIKDDRRLDVKKEYDLLYDVLEAFVNKYSDLYHTMKRVNVLIWDMMDLLRDGSLSEDEYLRICKECIEFNDIRFRVKNKINYVSNSGLREQKSYRINRIVIDIADSIIDTTEFILPVKYFSFIYDEILIVSNNEQLKSEFSYDPTVIFLNNIDADQVVYKNLFLFKDEIYSQSEIYEIFGLDTKTISHII
jgi:hypothetical protein